MEKKHKNLGSKTRAGLSWTLVGNFAKQFFTVAVSIIIARILGPEDYGVVALAMVFVAFSQIFIDVGFTEGVIQKSEISDTALSSVFIFNFAISVLLAILIYIFAPLIGIFFENDRVVDVIRYMVWILPIAALGKVHAAILSRNLKFKALSIRDVISAFLGGVAGLITAYLGFGIYSLVWQQLTNAIASTILLWIGSNWFPQLLFSWKEVKSLLAFSIYVFLDYLMQQFFNKLDVLFIGKVFSPATLGLYSRAQSLTNLTNELSTKSLSKILFPVFSSLQNDTEKLKIVLSKALALTLVVTTIFSGIMFFSAETIIIGLLGEKWRQSIVFFQILIFLTISLPLRTIVFKTLLALGYSKLRFKVNILSNIIKLMSIPVGYYFGIEAFAWAVITGRFVIVIIVWLALKSILDLDILNTIKPILLPISILTFWIVFYYMQIWDINMLYYLFLFLLTQLFLLQITKNYGFILLKSELKTVKAKILRKK